MTAQSRLFLAVGLGAALGSVARYLCSIGMQVMLGTGFAWGTLTVNVLGSFLIGLYATLTEPDGRLMASAATRQFVLSGFCGGFTTFSIFSLETLLLVERGAFALAAINVAASVILWLLAVWVGYRIGVHINRLKGTV
ncbi:MAG: CrcB family protein [Pseudolabrys sp.]|nr:CrcB family protein [Pseudolabrys sp.]